VFAFSCPAHRRRDRRRVLLAAALAMAVPGFLVTACGGQAVSAVSAAGRASAAGAGSAGRAGSTRDGAGASASAAAAAGRTSPAFPRRHSSALAARLLVQAASAAVLTSYQGEEIVSPWGSTGTTELVSDIWHISGGQTVTRTLATGPAASAQPYLSADNDGQEPEGVLGVTTALVGLLETHYIVVYAGSGAGPDNRPTQIVEAYRDDGSLAARFWLDDATKLPLEREVFDSSTHLISEDVFFNVQFGNQVPVVAPAGGPADPQGPWANPLPAGQLLALRGRGWLVRPVLPDGLSLFTGAQTQTSTGTVLDLGYSDGLSVISLFEQRGNLAPKLAGWQKITVGSDVIYAAGPNQRSLTWSSRGIVYTVLADAPSQTVDDVIGALPHDTPPGFWKRMTRGLARLASWVNPFR
jgi:sigma-E factor negative regulatory protein RseB